jgi:hypothetical protein
MQSSGATLVALLLAQEADAVEPRVRWWARPSRSMAQQVVHSGGE